jgi:hypothetical protein
LRVHQRDSRNADQIADKQPEQQGEDHVLQPPVADSGVACDHEGEPAEEIDEGEAGDVSDQVPSHEENPQGGEEEHRKPDPD